MFRWEGEGWRIKTFYKQIITSDYMLELNIFFTLNYMDLIYTLKIDLMLFSFLTKIVGGGGSCTYRYIYIFKTIPQPKKWVSEQLLLYIVELIYDLFSV